MSSISAPETASQRRSSLIEIEEDRMLADMQPFSAPALLRKGLEFLRKTSAINFQIRPLTSSSAAVLAQIEQFLLVFPNCPLSDDLKVREKQLELNKVIEQVKLSIA